MGKRSVLSTGFGHILKLNGAAVSGASPLVRANFIGHQCQNHLFPQQHHSPNQIRYMGTWPKIRPTRLRMITMDITGTLVSFKGSLSHHYLGTAKKCGVEIPEGAPIKRAFHEAYKETCRMYPCFGGKTMSAKEWWKLCVLRSFELCGTEMTEKQKELVFQRIYSTFGSKLAYEKFDDALPFLHWAQRHNLTCGVLSNADERYGDSILPMLGLTHDELQFQCYSKDLEVEKPNPNFFQMAMETGSPFLNSPDQLQPSEILHIGNDYLKDFEGARRVGIHAVLLDRYGETELAEEWRRRGAPVFEGLMDVVEFLGRAGTTYG